MKTFSQPKFTYISKPFHGREGKGRGTYLFSYKYLDYAPDPILLLDNYILGDGGWSR